MKEYEEQLGALLEYAKTIHKSSWQYNAILSEVDKLDKVLSSGYVPSIKKEPKKPYSFPSERMLFNIWIIAKSSADLREFKKRIWSNKYEITRLYGK